MLRSLNEGWIRETCSLWLVKEWTLCSFAVGIAYSTDLSQGTVQLNLHYKYITLFCEDNGDLSDNLNIANHSSCQETGN